MLKRKVKIFFCSYMFRSNWTETCRSKKIF